MPHFRKGDSEGHSLLAVVKQGSQFHFHSQTNDMLDDGRQGEDGAIIDGMFVTGQKIMPPCSALSSKFR